MKASLDKVVKIAEIIGSLGIVISLIFVSIQYQNNSLALQTSTANSVNANIAYEICFCPRICYSIRKV